MEVTFQRRGEGLLDNKIKNRLPVTQEGLLLYKEQRSTAARRDPWYRAMYCENVCLKQLSFVCRRLANHVLLRGSGSFAKTHVIHRILAACIRQLAITSVVMPFIATCRAEVCV
jgi:hypothetical protein